MKIPFAKVDCSGNEVVYVTEVLKSGWLTTASKTKEFESKFSELTRAKHALAVNSCTSGLHLALEAVGISSGDKVFVPSMTFTASAEVIRYLGADPVVLDVDPVTSGLSVSIVEAAIKKYPDVKAVIAVHFGGLALPMTGDNGLLALCKRNGIRIIEDAAHALPAKQEDRLVGNFGDITCFSFYANKTMTTGEGGMVITDDDELARRIKLMRLHGIDRDVWDRFTSQKTSWEYDVIAPGYKYNMPDLNAAVGLAQFEKLHEMHLERLRCAKCYFEELEGFGMLHLPYKPNNMIDHAWHLFPIRVSNKSKLSRNEVVDKLGSVGVGTSVHYKPIHRLSYYQNRYSLQASDFPNSESIWQTTLSLPIYNLLTNEEIKFVCDALKSILSPDEAL